MGKRAGLYVRGRHGLADQVDTCRAQAQQCGLHIVTELVENDQDMSGTSLPQLHRALEMARAGEFDVLVTRSPDRLSRDPDRLSSIEEELQEAGVEVVYARDPEAPPGIH